MRRRRRRQILPHIHTHQNDAQLFLKIGEFDRYRDTGYIGYIYVCCKVRVVVASIASIYSMVRRKCGVREYQSCSTSFFHTHTHQNDAQLFLKIGEFDRSTGYIHICVSMQSARGGGLRHPSGSGKPPFFPISRIPKVRKSRIFPRGNFRILSESMTFCTGK